MTATHYFWDKNKVRYQLISTHPGINYNWVFFPGGPGGDSQYLKSLVDLLALPGNSWLIDLPQNGGNVVDEPYDFHSWFNIFVPTIAQFKNVIYVGHSFGGMFPLLFPELENILTGLVLLNGSPEMWLEAAAKIAQEKQLPDISLSLKAFHENPNKENGNALLLDCMPYYFSKEYIPAGEKIFDGLPFNWTLSSQGLQTLTEMPYKATWVPQTVPTLIICGENDYMVPPTLFENDRRFHRENCIRHIIKDVGHAPWVEKPALMKQLFSAFIDRL